MSMLALCSRLPENELVAAECHHLTRGTPDEDGVAYCQTVEYVPQAAYIHTGMRLICKAATLAELCGKIKGLALASEGFRIDFQRYTDQNPVRSNEAILAVANALPGYPNLDAPTHRFLVLARREGLWFGEIINRTEHSYHKHDEKPYHTSSSLPPRLARAMVNLAWPAKSLLDPCCGTGSVLLEAATLGMQTYGVDRNPKMVGMSRKNLAHFGLTAEVARGSAQKYERNVDAIVTDLPYGRFCHSDPDNILTILKQAARLAPLGVFVSEGDLSSWLHESGYCSVESWRVAKRARMNRIVHRAIA
ncbi:MAG: TRM11 family SAM-dependent methyltransferase [Chloroflexota bacterium]